MSTHCKVAQNRNFCYGTQPCTDSVQILLQICSKSEPNVITGTSPIKAKDTAGSPFICSLPLQFPIRFTTLLFYKNKTNTEQKCNFSHIRYTNPPKNFTMRCFLLYKKKTNTKQKKNFSTIRQIICIQKSISARHLTDLRIAAKQYENQRPTEITRFL